MYLYDFEEYHSDPVTLKSAPVELRRHVSDSLATLVFPEIIASSLLDEIMAESREWVRAQGLRKLHAIFRQPNAVSPWNVTLPEVSPYRTVAIWDEPGFTPVRIHRPDLVLVPCTADEFQRLAPPLAEIMQRSIENHVRRRLVPPSALKGVERNAEEIRAYALDPGFGTGWYARGNAHPNPVGFSMSTCTPDDLGDSLGIGCYYLPEQPGDTWTALLVEARSWIKENTALPPQLTTWGKVAPFYVRAGMKVRWVYDIRAVPLDS